MQLPVAAEPRAGRASSLAAACTPRSQRELLDAKAHMSFL
uniref:Uncharacterized protein n=1 Tax=Arundo donax TaxID=35708 RepID=A0A0A8XS33_ARUDO